MTASSPTLKQQKSSLKKDSAMNFSVSPSSHGIMNQIARDGSIQMDAAESISYHEQIDSKHELEEIKQQVSSNNFNNMMAQSLKPIEENHKISKFKRKSQQNKALNQNFIDQQTAIDEESEINHPSKIKMSKIGEDNNNQFERVDTVNFESQQSHPNLNNDDTFAKQRLNTGEEA